MTEAAPAPPPAVTLPPGTLIDHFKVVRLLGRGGMGEVYLARDVRLGRRVALKLVRTSLGQSATAREHFLEEARATATFNHPHIVTIYDVGEHQGAPYVALEYLEGQTLRQRLAEEPPSAREAVRFALAIAQAIAEAHRHGVLHLDLKPDNVIIPRDGRLRVVDFGLARLAADRSETARVAVDESSSLLTTVSRAFGTPAYMAPELWHGLAPTAATDVWSFGVVLHELLYGRHPFGSAERWRSAEETPLPSLPEGTGREANESDGLTARAGALVLRALAPEPDDRPSAADLAASLEQLLGRPRPIDDERGPFRGLFAFGERHAEHFFGRDDEIRVAQERLREQPILAVVGRSGTGKSSFVQAGLLPRLREQALWQVLSLRPGATPLRALAARLLEDAGPTVSLEAARKKETTVPTVPSASAVDELAEGLRLRPERLGLMLQDLSEETGRRILLFVDQLEEIVTLVPDAVERDAFLRALASAADDVQTKVRVVLTVRDDFLSRLAETPAARALLAQVLVLRALAGSALVEVMTRPLEAIGYRFEDDRLGAAILAEVEDEQAILPLLQFTLQMLWERRDRTSRQLLRTAYEELGGVAGALAVHADEVLTGLDEVQLAAVKALLLRMVSAEGTRRVVGEKEALAGLPADAARVLERLTQARLISSRKAASGHGVEYELAHESLLVSWTRLARWLDESRGEVRFLSELAQAATLWERTGQQKGLLWTGAALEEARRAIDRAGDRVPQNARAFFAASLAETDLRRREDAAARALVEAQSAKAAFGRGDFLQARAQSRAALEVADSSEGRSLWWQLSQEPLLWEKPLGSSVTHVHFAPAGDRLVALADHNLFVIDADTLATRILRGHRDQVVSVAFAPSGTQIVSGTWSGHVGRWDLASGGFVSTREHTDSVWRIAFFDEGRRFVTASVDHSIAIWDLETMQVERRLLAHTAGVYGLALDREGTRVWSGGVDRRLASWDLATGALLAERILPGDGIRDVQLSPDGRELAVAMSDATIALCDPITLETRRLLVGHQGPLHRAIYSPDGGMLASASIDQTVRLWDVERGEAIAILRGHRSLVRGLSFSPDGRKLASTSYDKTVRLWQVGRSEVHRALRGHQGGIEGLAYSPTGRHIATGSQDRTVRLWDPTSGAVVRVLAGHEGNIGNVAFSKDGARVASACNDGTARIWDVESGAELQRLVVGTDRVCAVCFDPSGALLATGYGDGSVRVWEIDGAARVRFHHKAHPSDCRWVQFSPDGATLASTAHDDDVIAFWDVATGRSLRRLAGHKGGVVGVDFSRDQTQLVSAGFDETLRLWQLTDGSADGNPRIVGRHRSRVYKAMFHPDQRHVATASADATARLWDLRDGSFVEFGGHASEVNAAKLSPDGALLATASDDFQLRLHDTVTGRGRWRCPYVSQDGLERFSHRGWRRLDATSLAQPDAKWRAAVAERAVLLDLDSRRVWFDDGRGELSLWDTDADRELAVAGIEGGVAAVALFGKSAFALTSTGEVRQVVNPLDQPIPRDARALFSDGGRLYLVQDRELVVVGDVPNGRAAIAIDPGVVRALVSPSLDTIVLGYQDGFVEVRRSGADVVQLDASAPSPVRRLAWGPMGTLVVGFASGQVALHSLATGATLHHEMLHGAVAHLRLLSSPSRLYAATELGDETLLDLAVFDQPYDELIANVRQKIGVVWEGGRAVRR